jgi:hypothetical protein
VDAPFTRDAQAPLLVAAPKRRRLSRLLPIEVLPAI